MPTAAAMSTCQLIGQSERFNMAKRLIERMARFDVPVLIQGETGTGKELAARAIHYQSSRRDAPFVPLNCGGVPDSLIECELFGCERGAFTDARQARRGLVAAAEGGTLFFDELDSLSMHAQTTLLRFLQDNRYRPVGSSAELHGNVRVIAAAGARLQSLLAAGGFREDLAFRLNVLQLDMPPLRERTGDALLLCQHFIQRHARNHGVPTRLLDGPSARWVAQYRWPGNVRELDNLVQRALLLSEGAALDLCGQPALTECPQTAPPEADPAGMPDFRAARNQALAQFERDYLGRVMTAASGNVSHAARLAGKERRAMGKLLKKHGIDRAIFSGDASVVA